MKIGFIGVGKMASAIINTIKETDTSIIISGSSLERSIEIAKNLGVDYAKSHQELIDQVDLVVLGFKPQKFPSVLNGLVFKQAIMSMAAGITLEKLQQLTDDKLPLIRIMPNMNAIIRESTTAITFNEKVSEKWKGYCLQLTNQFGKTYEIDEKDFDTFTALAGSSPAFIYQFIEAMAKAGVNNGISKDKALEIVAQTVMASALNLQETNSNPNDLIDAICSPGGTTIAGLMDLEKNHFTHTISSAIDQTITKAKRL